MTYRTRIGDKLYDNEALRHDAAQLIVLHDSLADLLPKVCTRESTELVSTMRKMIKDHIETFSPAYAKAWRALETTD